jgi:uncharacterized membrane protein
MAVPSLSPEVMCQVGSCILENYGRQRKTRIGLPGKNFVARGPDHESNSLYLCKLESVMTVYVLAFVIGVIAGLRTMTAFAAISWAAYFGWVNLGGSWLEFLSSIWAACILTLLAVGELVTDQLPSTPSRTVPAQFGGRIFVGAVAGAAFGVPGHVWLMSAIAGVVGAVAGTLVGKEFRSWLAGTLKADRPAAFIEDAIAICCACLVALAIS